MITCGRCTKDAKTMGTFVGLDGETKHLTVAEVRACYEADESVLSRALNAYWEDEARAEQAAELRNEQWWENRGADDGFDEWEARRGVVTYEEARLLADGGR